MQTYVPEWKEGIIVGTLTKEEIIAFLKGDQELEEKLFQKAREQRKLVFKDKIFLYGFVYFSTWCRNNCNFCYFRRSNPIERYRKSRDEVMAVARQLTQSGVNLIDLTMGEDEKYHNEGFESLLAIVGQIKKELDMPVMISPGVIGKNLIEKFADLGTDWYALYQETHNRDLFKKLRWDQDYDERMEAKIYAKEKGILIEEGLLAGIGEGFEDIVDSLEIMGEIGASQVRVMSFIPQKGSPMENMKSPDRSLELRIIALMRLLYPKALIPASLDVDGIRGLKSRIDAGANVVTSIIPPKSGFVGVAQSRMDVDEGGRTAKEVCEILSTMGLRGATTEEYKEYLNEIK